MNRIMGRIYGLMRDISRISVFPKLDRVRDSLRDDLEVFYDLMGSSSGEEYTRYAEEYSRIEKKLEKLGKPQNLLNKLETEKHAN